jgi:hypothetical protein
MILYILAVLVLIGGLMVLPGTQLIPTILAQQDSLSDNTTGNTTDSTTGNTTESSEDELQQSGTISRKGQ